MLEWVSWCMRSFSGEELAKVVMLAWAIAMHGGCSKHPAEVVAGAESYLMGYWLASSVGRGSSTEGRMHREAPLLVGLS